MTARSERIENLIADICRRARVAYNPTPAEVTQMAANHGLEIRDAQPKGEDE
jgi:hypothetical protein